MDNNMDVYLFHRGEHRRAYEFLGAHPEKNGVQFRVWAPNAKSVRIVGDFNGWDSSANFMKKINDEGVWELKISNIKRGDLYKYSIENQWGDLNEKSDPYAFYSQYRPDTASVVYGLTKYKWNDHEWMQSRNRDESRELPVNIYEVHLGSWQRKDDGSFMNYRDIAHKLAEYVKYMNYTHIEVMPLSEYPLDDSWGYQITGYYSVTSRYGTPEDFKYFVDYMHQQGIGVIMDWVPGHFCKDAHGLYRFDGTPTYEYQNSQLGENPQWGTCNFDFSRYEVLSFLYSNALYWFREFHIDGIRIDAVANVLYMNFGKGHDFEVKNIYGGDENLDGINFLKALNHIIREEFPDIMTFAEDSTAWPFVTKPATEGGLGFTYKWNMGWMNDTLKYMEQDPVYRMHHHNNLTFSFMYAFAENYTLALSHDEVVHGKKSMLNKMPDWKLENKFANLRLYNAYMMAHPGKKLNFMGNEIAQGLEWRFYEALEWNVLNNPLNRDFHNYIKSLNNFYLKNSSLWSFDGDSKGFRWGDTVREDNTLSFVRMGRDKNDFLLCVFNFANNYKQSYKVGVPRLAIYEEVFNSSDSTPKNPGELHPKRAPLNEMPYHLEVDIPPLTALFFKGKFKR